MQAALAVSQATYWHLKQVNLFHSLTDWEVRQLGNIADLRLFKSGEEIYRTDDIADRIYILRSGKVKLFKSVGGDKEVIMGFQGPGDVFGEVAVTGEPARQECATVVEDAFVCMIDRDRLLGYLTQHPDLALQITRIIAKRRLDLEDRLIDLLSKDVGQRLAQALLRLADDYGDDDERGTRIGLRLTQTDLGQLVGSTRETTSMAFNRFRRAGYVEARDRVIWILDREGLAAI